MNFSEKFKAFVGVRVEKYIINYTGTTIGNITFDNDEFINTTDFFPSANLIYSVNDNRKFRASFYRTTARPSFKELSSLYHDYRTKSYNKERVFYEPWYNKIKNFVGKSSIEIENRQKNLDYIFVKKNINYNELTY